MIKVLHFSDLHLGVESYGRLDPATGLSSRLVDFLAVFDQVVNYALENDVDLVLFCGDAYKSRNPTQTQQREFARRISRLTSAGIPVFLVVGNHDLPNAIGRATAVEIFDTLSVQNMTVASKPGTHLVHTKNGPVQIVAMPWLRRSTLLACEEDKNLSLDQLGQRLQQILMDVLKQQVCNLEPGLPSILAAHVYVFGAKIGSEKTMTLGWEHFLLPGNLTNLGFDYVALGHIHKHQLLNEKPPLVYSGSLERIDFSEETEDKGFCVIQIEAKGQVSWEFHKVFARPFCTIKVNIPEQETDPTGAVLRAIAQAGQRTNQAVVRLVISLPEQKASQLQDLEIKKALEGAYFVNISKEVERQQRSRLGTLSAERLNPMDALRAYLEASKVSSERSRKILEYGERLLNKQSEL